MVATATPLKSSKGVGHYFDQDDYYRKGDSPSQWAGKAAEMLGLKGPVDRDTFRGLLVGTLPDGTQIHRGGANKRVGVDLTFSAPKSLSIAALVHGDTRITAIHKQAVEMALSHVESMAQCRVTQDKETTTKQTGNLIIGQFGHGTSRRIDPDLHDHAVILNITNNEGRWQALDNHPIFRDQMLVGAIYHQAMRQLCHEAGIATRDKPGAENGEFELAHISDRDIAEFSRGAAEIEAWLEARGKSRENSTEAQRLMANRATREAKREVDHETVRSAWIEKADALGIQREAIAHQGEIGPAAKSVVESALRHFSERESIFKEADVLRYSVAHGARLDDARAVLRELAAVGEIRMAETPGREIKRDGGRKEILRGESILTTREALERETQMLNRVRNQIGRHEALADEMTARVLFAGTGMNRGQQGAAETIVTSKDGVIAIQGVAGAGKTFALSQVRLALYGDNSPLRTAIEEKGYRVHGLAPTHTAAGEMRKTLGQADTLASFLSNPKAWGKYGAKDMIFVDEAGMASSKTMAELMKVQEKQGFRLVLIGDTRQFKAVEAGNPFKQIQDVAATVHMGESVRHKTDLVRDVAAAASAGQIPEAVRQLDEAGRITEVKDDAVRYRQMANMYLAEVRGITDVDARNNAARCLVNTNATRREVNAHIREGLGLAGKGSMVTTLSARDLTAEQRRFVKNYSVGNVVEFQKDYASLGAKKGDRIEIREIRNDHLVLSNGRQFYPQRIDTNKVSVLEREEIELSPGDAVRLRFNDRKAKICNGDYASVQAVRDGKIEIRLRGKTHTLPARDVLLQHGYAATGHSAQGATTGKTIMEAKDRESFYTNLTRSKTDVVVFVQDRQRFPELAARESIKSNALDMLNHEIQTTKPKVEQERLRETEMDLGI